MSDQVLQSVVLVEKVIHVSYPGHSYICANFRCKNILSDYEIRKQSKDISKRTRWNYCKKCRGYKQFDTIRCGRCLGPFSLLGTSTWIRSLCPDCRRIRKNEIQSRGQKTYWLKKANKRQCKYCNEDISLSRHIVFCSKICAYKDLLKKGREKTAKKVLALGKRNCKWCSTEIIPTRKTMCFCSSSCRAKQSHMNRRDKLIKKELCI